MLGRGDFSGRRGEVRSSLTRWGGVTVKRGGRNNFRGCVNGGDMALGGSTSAEGWDDV